ncbi:hypothetical protein MP638_006493 [Amoeboaphelidium occidentale]|nr:hypothetical protein MP638_006493 [Amoeboaphelidium occidentale]
MLSLFGRRIYPPRVFRSYSTAHRRGYLWVKKGGDDSFKVPISGCVDVYDFSQNVKKELNATCSVMLFTAPGKEALAPTLKMEDLLHTDAFKRNSDTSPLYTEIASKTIFIRDIDEECRPLKTFTKFLVENDAGLRGIFENKGSSLFRVSDPDKKITSFLQLEDGEKYEVHSRYEKSFIDKVRWQQMEDKAMEHEVGLAMKNYLEKQLGSNVVSAPTKVFGPNNHVVQEWDAALKAGETLYLCEAKHVMSNTKLEAIVRRIEVFRKKFQPRAQADLSDGIRKIVGVACGTHFDHDVREKAHSLGLICVYPSGSRYLVDKKTTREFKIEY